MQETYFDRACVSVENCCLSTESTLPAEPLASVCVRREGWERGAEGGGREGWKGGREKRKEREWVGKGRRGTRRGQREQES